MGQDLELSSASAEETRRIAAHVAAHLRPGDVVALTGELGAGKTCFVQGAAPVLGVTDRVTSPSFVLRRDYDGRLGLVHLDVYRLNSLREVVELGFDDVFDAHRVTFVEWGDAVRPLLPPDFLEVELRRADDELDADLGESAGADTDDIDDTDDSDDSGEEQRLLRIRAHGDGWAQRMGALAADLSRWRVTGAPGATERFSGEGLEAGGAA